MTSLARVLLSVGVALALSALWVGLTALTRKTYHLAPVLIAAAPVIISAGGRRRTTPASLLGLAAVGLGWLVIEVLDIEPTATFVDGQPGGVPGEVITGSLMGLAAGAALAARRRRRAMGAA